MNSGFFPAKMQTLDTIDFQPIWLAPEHLAQTAAFVMKGHRLSLLAVVKNHTVLGYVDLATIESAPTEAQLAEILRPFPMTMDSTFTLRQAANAFVKDDLASVPVLKGDRFLGILTSNRLLQELFRSSDPLTGLSWVDLLREWGIGQLRNGVEVCLLALDLDQFGKVNQSIGHRRADILLQKFADFMGGLIEPRSDVLVRVSGDKFMVGTTRPREDLQVLGERIAAGVPDVLGEGLAIAPTITWGLAGGRRTHERNVVHPESNIDDLIKLALNHARQRKGTASARLETPSHAVVTPNQEGATTQMSRIELVLAEYDERSTVRVRIRAREEEFEKSSNVTGGSLPGAAANATIDAVRAATNISGIGLESATVFHGTEGKVIAAVTGFLELAGTRHRFAGSNEGENPVTATALATLQGLNESGLASSFS